MVAKKYQDYLLNVYQEMNIHHREQTSQNNQIITFYIVLISFFIGFHNELAKEYNIVLNNLVYIMLIVIGTIVNLTLIQLRTWQLRYASGLQLIGSMFICDKKIKNFDDFYDCIKEFECRSATKHSLIAPLTCKMIWGCIIISLAPFGLYYTYLNKFFLDCSHIILIIFIFIICVYLVLIYMYFKNKINSTGRKGEINWLMNYLNFRQDFDTVVKKGKNHSK